MNRRQFVRTTAAAAVLPVVGVADIATKAEAIAPEAEPLAAYPFKWWISSDGETYFEDCDTREQALLMAKDYGAKFIAECQQEDFDLSISGSEMLEVLYGQNEEAVGDGEFIECTPEQERELGRMVSDAIEAWVRKHKISTTAWQFGVVRNKTEIEPNAVASV